MNFIRTCNKIIEYSFYALFFLVPLVFTNDTSELFELNKMWLTWGLTILISTAWISKMFAEKQIKIQRTPLDIPILLFLLSQIISTIFSMDQRVSLWGYYSRFNGGLLSILSYIILYYAFVTTFSDLRNEPEKKHWFGMPARIGIYLTALALLPLGILMAAPPQSDPTAGNSWLLFMLMGISLVMIFFSLSRDFLKRTFYMLLSGAVVVALWGLPSHFGYDPTCLLFRGTFDVTCWTEQFRPTIRMFSTLGQPAWFTAYMAAIIPLTIAFTIFRKPKPEITHDPKHQNHKQHQKTAPRENASKFWPYLFYGLTVLFYADLLYGNTRAGFIAFWVGNAIFWAGLFFLRTFTFNKFIRYFLLFNLTFMLLNFLIRIPFGQFDKYTLTHLLSQSRQTTSQPAPQPTQAPTQPQQPTNETGTSTGLDTGITDSGKIREFVWQGAIDAWRANPIFGTGVETFAYAYYRYRPVGHNLTSEWDFLYNKAHNEYLNYLTTTGIFGLGTYLLMIGGFYFLMLKRYLKQLMNKSESRSANSILSLALIAGYTTILITNFFGFSVVIMNIFLFMFPVFAFILDDMIHFQKAFVLPRSAKPVQDQKKDLQIGGGAWLGIGTVVMVAFIMLLMLLTFWNADRAYYWGSNYNKINEFQQAYTKLKEATDLRGAEPIFKHEFAYTNAAIGAALMQNNDMTQGQQLAQTALRLSNEVLQSHPNNVVFWKDRVRMMYLLSQVDRQTYLPYALESIQRAYQLAPSDAKIVYNLGVITGQAGDVNKAIQILQTATQMKPDYRDVYFALGIFYRDLATQGTETVKDPQMQQKANESLLYILNNITQNDNPTKETLKSWGVNPDGSTLPASTSATQPQQQKSRTKQ
jgi:putative inorganic carbon (hco3(-)) transporter